MSEAAGDKVAEVKSLLMCLTNLETAQLTKELEEEWGVSAAMPMGGFAMAAAPGAGADAEEEEEKSSFDVVLNSFGDAKLQVIKAVRANTSLGLKEAKDIVEACPKPVKEGCTKEEADKMKKELEEAGATVELK